MWLRVNERRTTRARLSRTARRPRASARGARATSRPRVVLDAPQRRRCAARGSRQAKCRCRTSPRSARRGCSTSRRGSACSMRARHRAARPGTSSKPARARRGLGASIATPRRLDAGRATTCDRLGSRARLVAGDATRPERVVGRAAVRPDPARRAVQRGRRDPPPSRHQGAAPPGRRRARGRTRRPACCERCGRCSRPGGRLVYATCSVLRARERRADRGVSQRGRAAIEAGQERGS